MRSGPLAATLAFGLPICSSLGLILWNKRPFEGGKEMKATRWFVCLVLPLYLFAFTSANAAFAQITTATVGGTVHDPSGATIPGATVTLTSTAKGTSEETTTSAEGDFTFPTVSADTYTVKVALSGFKTLERPGIVVHPGDKISLGTMVVGVGALEETVTVAGDAPMIQSQSGERAYAIASEAIEAIAQNGRNFNGF